MYTSKLCISHQQPIILKDPNQINGSYCLICLQKMTGLVAPEVFQQQLQQIIQDANQDSSNTTQQLNKMLYSVLNLKTSIISHLDNIIKNILDQTKIIESKMSEYQKIIKKQNNQQVSLESLKNDANQLKINNQTVQTQIKQQFLDLKKKISENDMFINLIQEDEKIQISQDTTMFSDDMAQQLLQDSNNVKQDEINQQEKLEQKLFSYESIQDASFQNNQFCRDFAFNRDYTMLLAACEKVIIIYEFNNGKIGKELQKLTDHTNNINCLYSMKQSDSLVSGDWDKTIIIWDLVNGVWKSNFVLKEHEKTVICLLMNRVEDMLISGGGDKLLKFWKKNQENWNCLQTIQTNQTLSDISLNEEETKLISCGCYEQIIIIFEKNNNQQWKVIQIIVMNERVLRLSFTFGNCFVFQIRSKDILNVFDFNSTKKLFLNIQTVQVKGYKNCSGLFPSRFIKEKQILAIKYGEQLNLFSVDNGNIFKLQQIIQFGTVMAYGKISNDGKYLVTWDDKTKEIQVRQLQYSA